MPSVNTNALLGTALVMCCKAQPKNSPAIIRLIEVGADVDFICSSSTGMPKILNCTPLVAAIASSNEHLVRILLKVRSFFHPLLCGISYAEQR